MRIRAGLLGFAMLMPIPAGAVTQPSPDQLRALERLFDSTVAAEDKANVERLSLSIAKDEKPPNPAKIEMKQALLQQAEQVRDDAYDTAIQALIRDYGLLPNPPPGTVVLPGHTAGDPVHWQVIGRQIKDRTVENSSGDKKTVKKPKRPAAGVTYGDGVSIINTAAFVRGPGFVAATILHELTHYTQITTRDKGDLLTLAEMDEAAYAAQLMHKQKFLAGTYPMYRDQSEYEWKAYHAENQVQADIDRTERGSVKGWFKKTFTAEDPEILPSSPLTLDELERIRRNTERIKRRLEAENAAMLERKRQQEEARRLFSMVDSSDPDADRRTRSEGSAQEPNDGRRQNPYHPSPGPRGKAGPHHRLWDLALQACATPAGSVSAGESSRVAADGFPYDESLASGLPEGCARTLYLELLRWNRRGPKGTMLDVGWLNSRARGLSPALAPSEQAPQQPSQSNPRQPAPTFKEPPRMGQPGTGPARRQLDGIRRGSGGFN